MQVAAVQTSRARVPGEDAAGRTFPRRRLAARDWQHMKGIPLRVAIPPSWTCARITRGPSTGEFLLRLPINSLFATACLSRCHSMRAYSKCAGCPVQVLITSKQLMRRSHGVTLLQTASSPPLDWIQGSWCGGIGMRSLEETGCTQV